MTRTPERLAPAKRLNVVAEIPAATLPMRRGKAFERDMFGCAVRSNATATRVKKELGIRRYPKYAAAPPVPYVARARRSFMVVYAEAAASAGAAAAAASG